MIFYTMRFQDIVWKVEDNLSVSRWNSVKREWQKAVTTNKELIQSKEDGRVYQISEKEANELIAESIKSERQVDPNRH